MTESALDAPDRLVDLIARATAAYAVKDYSPAAELYSQATELQAEMNGEMAPENADLLYSYGKCLYFVAVRNSEVLGGGAAGAKLSGSSDGRPKAGKKRKISGNGSLPETKNGTTDVTVETTQHDSAAALDAPTASETVASTSDKPLFQISGDAEGWDDSSEGDDIEGDSDREGDEEDQDDFSLAFEVLDLSRVLLLRKLETLQQTTLDSAEKGKHVASAELSPEVREAKVRLADVHDLQAEIALEGERYGNAVEDLKAALALKEELYPFESNYVAECYFKLSLALEFGSKSQQRDSEGNPVGEIQVDEAMLSESIGAMESAIESCRRRIKKEELEVENLERGENRDKAVKDVEEVREIVEEMETRLAELQAPQIDAVQEAGRQQAIENAAGGLLAEILGGSKEEVKRKLEEASGNARDLTGLVKRKKPKAEASASATPEPAAETNGTGAKKRKVGFVDEVEGKRAKVTVDDAEDSGL